MRAFVIAVFAFLYLPIVLVVLFSFNAGRHASDFTGFSTQWYGLALSNPFLTEALKNSLFVATFSALLAAISGTAAALGLTRVAPERYSTHCWALRSLFQGLSSGSLLWSPWFSFSLCSIPWSPHCGLANNPRNSHSVTGRSLPRMDCFPWPW